MTRAGRGAPLLLLAGAAACAGVVAWGPGGLLQLACGLLLGCILPGASLLLLLRRDSAWEKAFTIVAGSIGILAVTGVVLHLTAHLTRMGWSLALLAIVAAFSIAALLIGGRRPAAVRSGEQGPGLPSGSLVAAVVLAALAVAGSIQVARQGVVYGNVPGFTELWLQSAPGALTFGIRNMETEPQSYVLQILSPAGEIASYPYLPLKVGETWNGALPADRVPLPGSAIEARLLRTSNPGLVYRRATAIMPPS